MLMNRAWLRRSAVAAVAAAALAVPGITPGIAAVAPTSTVVIN